MGIPVKLGTDHKWYQFRPDAAILRGLELYLLVEVESKNNDYARMLLCGASIVRWMCMECPYRFILPLLYISQTGQSELLYMYQLDDKDKGKV